MLTGRTDEAVMRASPGSWTDHPGRSWFLVADSLPELPGSHVEMTSRTAEISGNHERTALIARLAKGTPHGHDVESKKQAPAVKKAPSEGHKRPAVLQHKDRNSLDDIR